MNFNRQAFTLLEVVVGLVLMGSLVAFGLVALSSHQHAIALAKQKQQANLVADELLTKWYEVQGAPPVRGQGIVVQNQEWMWRTQPVGSRSVCGLQTNVVRLEILGRAGNARGLAVLVSLDLLQTPNASGLQ